MNEMKWEERFCSASLTRTDFFVTTSVVSGWRRASIWNIAVLANYFLAQLEYDGELVVFVVFRVNGIFL